MTICPRAWWGLKLAVAGTLLGWVLSQANLALLWQLLASQSWDVLVGFGAIQFLAVAVATVKWRVLLPHEAFGLLLRLNMVAQFYSLIVPGQLGAEAIKAYQLGRGRPEAETIAASVILDKITGLLSLLAFGLFGSLTTELPIGQALSTTFAAASATIVIVLIGIRVPSMQAQLHGWLEHMARLLPSLERQFRQFLLFIEAWRRYLKQTPALFRSFGIGLILQSVYIGMVVLMSQQFGFTLPVKEWCWIFSLVSLASVLPITLAGIGVREGVFVGLLAEFSVPAEKALALSVTLLSLHILLGLAGGVYWFLRPPDTGR